MSERKFCVVHLGDRSTSSEFCRLLRQFNRDFINTREQINKQFCHRVIEEIDEETARKYIAFNGLQKKGSEVYEIINGRFTEFSLNFL